ncbi:MAG: response regulator, partial [Stenotrophobium sp.]
IYTTLLTKEGYEVEFAGDGKDALDKAVKTPPDLILLDLLMPVLDGIGFLRAYNLKVRHPQVKVIVFSNTEMPDKLREAKELGAVRYMAKFHFTPTALVSLIKEELAG